MDQTLGKRIVANRKRLGLTQDALAERLGVTAQAISKWENDQSCPDITMLPKLAEVFSISTDELLGLEKKEVHMAEVVEEKEKDSEEPNGFHVENGTWELKWDGGRRSSVGIAVWMLLSGFLLFLSKDSGMNASLWDVLWTSGLTLFGLFGVLYPRFSLFRLGCAFLGGHYLCSKVFGLALNTDYIVIVFLLCLGTFLLIQALRKPRHGSFFINHNGKSLASSTRNHCTYQGNRFECATSFGGNHHLIQLPVLEGGEASVSFGEMTVDLSGCQTLAENCRLELNCSFGELELLVPRKYRVETAESTAFAAIDTQGTPAPDAVGTICLECNASFGEISIHYI